jgi:hypothetical protein
MAAEKSTTRYCEWYATAPATKVMNRAQRGPECRCPCPACEEGEHEFEDCWNERGDVPRRTATLHAEAAELLVKMLLLAQQVVKKLPERENSMHQVAMQVAESFGIAEDEEFRDTEFTEDEQAKLAQEMIDYAERKPKRLRAAAPQATLAVHA